MSSRQPGPELVLEPSSYFPALTWWNQIGIRFTYLTTFNEPLDNSPAVRGRGYETSFWLDLAGWRPSISFWKGRQFLSQQGDPEFAASNFPEFGLSKIIPLGESASIEFGVQARRIRAFFTEEGIAIRTGTRSNGSTSRISSFNWNWDTGRSRLLGDLFAQLLRPSRSRTSRPAPIHGQARHADLYIQYRLFRH